MFTLFENGSLTSLNKSGIFGSQLQRTHPCDCLLLALYRHHVICLESVAIHGMLCEKKFHGLEFSQLKVLNETTNTNLLVAGSAAT